MNDKVNSLNDMISDLNCNHHQLNLNYNNLLDVSNQYKNDINNYKAIVKEQDLNIESIKKQLGLSENKGKMLKQKEDYLKAEIKKGIADVENLNVKIKNLEKIKEV